MTPYPVTITQSRYRGTYEGAEWIAFHLSAHDIPQQAFADDVPCLDWWLAHGDGVGKGATPGEALENLITIEEPLQLIRDADARESQLGRAPWKR